MRKITHPGPRLGLRADILACQAVPVRATLRAGETLTRAITHGLAKAGFANGYLRLDGASCAPMNYVMPAPAPGDGHAAWYSQTYTQPLAQIQHGGAHLGLRDGRPFVHCHALWREPEQGMGHVLCDDSILADDVTVQGWGLAGVGLVAAPDAETLFTLFRPQKRQEPVSTDAFLITLRPNQDICAALMGIAHRHGVTRARVEGIGSLVGTVFEDAPGLDSYATEVLILDGVLHNGKARVQVASVGFDGAVQQGWLRARENAICITAEVVMIVV
jgi:hypothetical protein